MSLAHTLYQSDRVHALRGPGLIVYAACLLVAGCRLNYDAKAFTDASLDASLDSSLPLQPLCEGTASWGQGGEPSSPGVYDGDTYPLLNVTERQLGCRYEVLVEGAGGGRVGGKAAVRAVAVTVNAAQLATKAPLAAALASQVLFM